MRCMRVLWRWAPVPLPLVRMCLIVLSTGVRSSVSVRTGPTWSIMAFTHAFPERGRFSSGWIRSSSSPNLLPRGQTQHLGWHRGRRLSVHPFSCGGLEPSGFLAEYRGASHDGHAAMAVDGYGYGYGFFEL